MTLKVKVKNVQCRQGRELEAWLFGNFQVPTRYHVHDGFPLLRFTFPLASRRGGRERDKRIVIFSCEIT